jgi:hypothetical protein
MILGAFRLIGLAQCPAQENKKPENNADREQENRQITNADHSKSIRSFCACASQNRQTD